MRISETTMAKVQILESDRSKLPEAVLCRVVYPICNIGQLNANNRVYEREVWEKVLGDEAICEKMAGRTLFGQAEHPAETQSDLQLTSHTIFEMWIDENDGRVYQKMDVLDTPTGRIVDTLLRAGCQVGVSTRAEGDLEDFELEEGKTCQRVVPESYRYVTTDFTADPSTFNVAPVALQRNVIPTLQREMKSAEARPLAKALLESIQKVGEAHTSLAVTADDGTQVSVEAEGAVEVHTSPQGDVSINPEKPLPEPMEPVEPAIEPGNTGLGMPAIEPEGEMGEPPMEEPEEEMPESAEKAIETTLTEEAWLELSDADLQRYSTVLEGEAFQKCVSGGGRVRRVSGDKEHGLKPDEYVNYCFHGGKSYRGEVHTKENESKVNEATTWEDLGWRHKQPVPFDRGAPDLTGYKVRSPKGEDFEVIDVFDKGLVVQDPDDPRARHDLYVGDDFVYERPNRRWQLIGPDGEAVNVDRKEEMEESEVSESPLSVDDVKSLFKSIDPAFAKHLTGVATCSKDAAARGADVGLELTDAGRAALEESEVKEGRQVVRMEGDSVGEVVFDTNDDGTFTITVKGETIATGTWSGGGTMDAKVTDINQLIDVLGDVMFTHGEVNVEESQTYRDLVDLKVTEASVRAERDALMEAAQGGEDAKVQIRILADKLTQVQESSAAEIAGLRRVLERKAQEAGISKQQLDEALKTRKSEAELNAMFTAHQEELVQAVNEAKALARADMLREYFDRRLTGSNLQVDENSRALLEGCQSLGDVDSLVDKLIGVARRSALHAKPLSEVKVHKVEPMDPEQRKADESVGKLMKHLSS